MRMTIDEAILYMELYKRKLFDSVSDLDKDIEAYDMVINIMRKYQKIEKLYEVYLKDLMTNIYADRKFIKALDEVMEDTLKKMKLEIEGLDRCTLRGEVTPLVNVD